MKNTNPKIDAYIAQSAGFAQPILTHIRKLIHGACPDVEEEIKWSLPHFSYQGSTIATFGAYKAHVNFSLFNAHLLKDQKMKEAVEAGRKFGYMDKVKTLAELPSDKVIAGYIKEVVAANASGASAAAKPSSAGSAAAKKPPVDVEAPAFFLERLNKHAKAKKMWESKTPSFRKEYAKWLNEAKTDETKEKRATQCLEWIAEGKGRFWQYAK